MSFMQPKLQVVNTTPKLRLQHCVRTEFSSLKCGKDLKPRKIIHFVWDQKIILKCGMILNSDSTVSTFGTVSRLLPESAHEALAVSCVG
jgi:hypothetical protein